MVSSPKITNESPHSDSIHFNFSLLFLTGFFEHLEVNVCTSNARGFPMVDFVDTPGLVDGGIVYPFDPNKLIQRLAAISDIIFVFMDPHGGSNCTRTMSVVRALNVSFTLCISKLKPHPSH